MLLSSDSERDVGHGCATWDGDSSVLFGVRSFWLPVSSRSCSYRSPRIECCCGASLPHEHRVLGSSPQHLHGETSVPRWAGPAEDAQLKADSDLRVITGLPLVAEFPEPLTARQRGRAPWDATIDHPVGVQLDPESPPPRSSFDSV